LKEKAIFKEITILKEKAIFKGRERKV